MRTLMKGIDLGDRFRLVALWRLHGKDRWELVQLARCNIAIALCRHDPSHTLYAFTPDAVPGKVKRDDYY